MDYRREIDGLRAIAVLPVMLFHADFQTFSGGFVGVDVFFVISGYLITTIILAELQAGKFSIINFYERRARRILPALFVIMLACLPFAWLWLMPQDMKSFSQSLAAVSTFASNILFWRTSGYFESAAELKPLLHTWSLAVEEQYYLFFPIFLMLTWRLGKRWILWLLAAAFVVSLAGAQWYSVVKPEAAFYLLPTRGWELLVGAFIAFYFANGSNRNPAKVLSEVAGVIGIMLIIYAIFVFDKQTPFPSLYTLVPTFGTALILLWATQNTFVGKLLGNKVFVGIGLISYSAYLWHQPLFAFAKHRSLEEPSQALLGFLAIISIVLAYFSWKYVETPFRDKKLFNRKKIFLFGSVGSVFFISVGLAGHFTNGFAGRIDGERGQFLSHFDNSIPEWRYFIRVDIPDLFRTQCNFYDIPKYRSGYATTVPLTEISEECYVRDTDFKYSVFLWGDSHAQQLYPGLKRMLPADWQILQVTSSGCKPKLKASPSSQNFCEHSNWFAYKTILDTKPDVVVIGQVLNHNIANMALLSEQLRSIGVKKVIFTGPTPHWTTDLPKVVVKLWDNVPRRTRLGSDSKVIELDRNLKRDFQQTDSVRFVSIVDNFCNESGCLVYLGDSIKDGITSWDYGHLTPIASLDFSKNVLVKEILR